MRRIAATLKAPLLVVWGRREAETSKPIYAAAAASQGREAYASSAGRHGSSILFEDPVAWARVRAFLERVTRRR